MRISTIVPAYNREALIGETLRSILEQSRPPDEVIVVDDGSSDGTCDAVTAFGGAVTLLRQANRGPGAARNAGFAASSGEIVHFMDSDDLASLNFYACAAPLLETGAAMTYGPWLKCRICGRAVQPHEPVLQQGPIPPGSRLDELTLALVWGIVLQTCLFDRRLLESSGPYREDMLNWEDNELLYRIARQAPAIAHAAKGLILYRVHREGQLTARGDDRRLRDEADLLLQFAREIRLRSDLDRATVRRLRHRRLEVARAVRSSDPDRAAALEADVTAIERFARPLRAMADRSWAWLGARALGNAYPAAFAAGPLTAAQRELIGLLGYAPAGE